MEDRVIYEISPKPDGGWDVIRPALTRLRDFRSERIRLIKAGQTSVPWNRGRRSRCTWFPKRPSQGLWTSDVKPFSNRAAQLIPRGAHGCNYRFNADGFLTELAVRDGEFESHLQCFRNATVETVASHLVRSRGETPFLASLSFEQDVIEAVSRLHAFLGALGIGGRVFAGLSLIGARSSGLAADLSGHWRDPGHTVDRKVLEVPFVSIDGTDAGTALRPAFDYVWQAAGWPDSQYYNANGKRTR